MDAFPFLLSYRKYKYTGHSDTATFQASQKDPASFDEAKQPRPGLDALTS